jgi:L-ascorbate metabolism protein UlaG (beta-lactamase superfamily)
MRLTKFTHACVRLTDGDRALVIDPGIWAEESALDGVTDVLITHEHFDHVDTKRLAGRELTIHAPAAVVELLAAAGVTATAVEPGQRFTAAGFDVRTVGGRHADVYGGMPGCANIGYVVDEDVYHPGDSVFVPDVPVRTLLIPAAGPWLKLAESIDFARAVKPVRAFPTHDAPLNEIGQGMVDGWLGRTAETDYQRIPVGDSVAI